MSEKNITIRLETKDDYKAFEQFEATFPKKEKLKLPGQLF